MVAAEVEAVGSQQRLRALVVERGPLQLEEQQCRLDRRAALLRELQQRAVGGLGGVSGEPQPRIRASAPDQLVDGGQLVHGLDQAAGIELRDPSGVALREGLRALQRLPEAALDALRPLAVEQRLQVPRGLLQLGIGSSGGGLRGGHLRAA